MKNSRNLIEIQLLNAKKINTKQEIRHDLTLDDKNKVTKQKCQKVNFVIKWKILAMKGEN